MTQYICAYCDCLAEVAVEVLTSGAKLTCNECGERTTVKSLHLVAHEYDCADILYRSAVAFPKE